MLQRLPEVFASLRSHDVKYLVIGGVAASLYGVPRATFDLDILIEATSQNAQRLLDALTEAGFGTASLVTAADVLAQQILIFEDRVKIDVQIATLGLSFADAWERRVTMTYAGRTFHVVSKADLIASKLAAGRPVDLEDVRLLRLADEAQPGDGPA